MIIKPLNTIKTLENGKQIRWIYLSYLHKSFIDGVLSLNENDL